MGLAVWLGQTRVSALDLYLAASEQLAEDQAEEISRRTTRVVKTQFGQMPIWQRVLCVVSMASGIFLFAWALLDLLGLVYPLPGINSDGKIYFLPHWKSAFFEFAMGLALLFLAGQFRQKEVRYPDVVVEDGLRKLGPSILRDGGPRAQS